MLPRGRTPVCGYAAEIVLVIVKGAWVRSVRKGLDDIVFSFESSLKVTDSFSHPLHIILHVIYKPQLIFYLKVGAISLVIRAAFRELEVDFLAAFQGIKLLPRDFLDDDMVVRSMNIPIIQHQGQGLFIKLRCILIDHGPLGLVQAGVERGENIKLGRVSS